MVDPEVERVQLGADLDVDERAVHLARSDLGDERDAALHALAALGDQESMAALEASRAKIPKGFPVQHQALDAALRRIRARGA